MYRSCINEGLRQSMLGMPRWGFTARRWLVVVTLMLSIDIQANESEQPIPATQAAVEDRLSTEDNITAAGLEKQREKESRSETLSTEEISEELPSILPHNLSPWGMFIAADWVVKAVMIGLAIASLLTWTVLVAKSIELGSVKKKLKKSLNHLSAAGALSDVTNSGKLSDISLELLKAAEAELNVSADFLAQQKEGNHFKEGIKERVASRLSRIEVSASRSMLTGTGLLATVGSVAPFVGLFGTVWGIMNSFIGISQANTTNLAVVAPGIAEALLATALGLVAAIPAVMIYNHFTRKIAGIKALVSDCAAAVMRLLSRDLDRGLKSQTPVSQKTRL